MKGEGEEKREKKKKTVSRASASRGVEHLFSFTGSAVVWKEQKKKGGKKEKKKEYSEIFGRERDLITVIERGSQKRRARKEKKKTFDKLYPCPFTSKNFLNNI